MLVWILVLIVVALLAYIRLAPSDPARWHQQAPYAGTESRNLEGGYIWREMLDAGDDGSAKLKALSEAAMATPRTSLLAGSVAEGKLTYVTRSQVFGFPDYTTMGIYQTPEGQRFIEVFARLRFGRSDLGVNAKRVKSWIGVL